MEAETSRSCSSRPARPSSADHAAELAVKSRSQLLGRYRRSLLLRLEHAHRSAVENHVHRPPRLGSRRSPNLRIGISDAPHMLPTARVGEQHDPKNARSSPRGWPLSAARPREHQVFPTKYWSEWQDFELAPPRPLREPARGQRPSSTSYS